MKQPAFRTDLNSPERVVDPKTGQIPACSPALQQFLETQRRLDSLLPKGGLVTDLKRLVPPLPPLPKLLTGAEVIAWLQIGEGPDQGKPTPGNLERLRGMRRMRTIPYVQHGRLIRYPEAELAAWISRSSVTPRPKSPVTWKSSLK